MLGIVTVTYNSGEVLRPFLDDVLAQTRDDYRLYVIDNNSTDQTRAILTEYQDARFCCILNETNTGVAEANNQGIHSALREGADWVLLINNDTEFPPDFLEKAMNFVQVGQAEVLAPLVYFYDPPDKPWFSGGTFIPWRAYRNTHSVKGVSGPREIEYAPTCCLLVHSDVFRKVGFMDPVYFVYSDDADFCWRLNKAGVRIRYSEEMWIFHKASSLTGGLESNFALRYMMRNRVLFVRKHAPFLMLLWALMYLQAEIFYKLIFISKNFTAFRVQQKAFREGLRIPLPK